jgi:diguanylate cyclase (GGDEF)-like protein/PAS domain S-box-containing protein
LPLGQAAQPGHQIPVASQADDAPRITFGRTLITQDGRRLPVDESVAPILDDRGLVIGTVCALRDVSARVQAEQALRRSEERFRTAFDFAPMGMALVALDGCFLQGNAAMHTLLRCTGQQLLGLRQDDVTLAEEAGDEQERLHELRASSSPFVQFEKRFRAVDGHVFWAQVSVSLLKTDDAALCYLYQVHDLSARKEAEQALLQLAHVDALTGLHNRARMTDELQGWVLAAQRHGRRFAVLFMDLDLFKQANDQHGHAVGDEVLRCTAQRLRQGLRASDKVGRWGGDEFVALVADLPDLGHAVSVVRKLSAAFEAPMEIAGHRIPIGLSMGVALYPEDGSDADVLLRHADAALYRAKARGRGQAQFYSSEVCEQLQLRRAQGQALARALAEDRLHMQYRPVVSVQGDASRWLQASAHWTDGAGEVWGTAQLQRLANERGLDGELAAWQLRRACLDAAAWSDPQLAVAVPMAHCAWRSDRWLHTVAKTLADSGLAPQRLGLDIEAGALAQDGSARVSRLARLADLGVGLSLRLGCTDALRPDWLQRLRPVWLKLVPVASGAEAMAQANAAEDTDASQSLARTIPLLSGLAHGLGARLMLLADGDARALQTWREAGGEWVCSQLLEPGTSRSPPG